MKPLQAMSCRKGSAEGEGDQPVRTTADQGGSRTMEDDDIERGPSPSWQCLSVAAQLHGEEGEEAALWASVGTNLDGPSPSR